MKIESVKPEKVFDPITISIESEGELAFFRDVFGQTSRSVSEAYGVDSFSPVFNFLDNAVGRLEIQRNNPKIEIEFNKKG